MSNIDNESTPVSLGSAAAGTRIARIAARGHALDAGRGTALDAGRASEPAKRKPQGSPVEAKLHGLEAPPPSWSGAVQHANRLLALRRRRKWRFLLAFSVVVLVPTCATLAYFLWVASPRYSSEFEFTYQTYRGPASLASGLLDNATGTSQSNTIDIASLVYEYVRSPALLQTLDDSLNLRKAYGDPKIDYLSRLQPDASREAFLNLFRSYVTVSQGLGGYLTVKVQAFDPAFAETLAKAVFNACDRMVDSISARARDDQTRLAESELKVQETRILKARQAMADFQAQHGDLDPQHKADQISQVTAGLETDLASDKAQLAALSSTLNPGSPIITEMKSRIAALQLQLQQQAARLAGKTDQNTYSDVLNQYSALQMEQEFAKTAYMQAQQGVVVARADAAAKRNYLVDFAPPVRPERMDLMIPLQYVLTVFLGSLVFFGFFSIVMGAFQDHADF